MGFESFDWLLSGTRREPVSGRIGLTSESGKGSVREKQRVEHVVNQEPRVEIGDDLAARTLC